MTERRLPNGMAPRLLSHEAEWFRRHNDVLKFIAAAKSGGTEATA